MAVYRLLLRERPEGVRAPLRAAGDPVSGIAGRPWYAQRSSPDTKTDHTRLPQRCESRVRFVFRQSRIFRRADTNQQTGKMENREMEEQDSLLRVGVVTQPHGLKGQVNVYPTTDEPGMFRVWKTLILSGKGGPREVPLESAAYFKQMVILKLGGIDDRDAAERIRRCELFIRRSQAGPCAENEHFVADLIGLNAVEENGTVLGTCADVMKTAANDVFVIQREGRKDLLIPAIPQCILGIDPAGKKILVHLLPGMLECYD